MDKLTIAQYETLVKAYSLKQVDEDYRVHQQAFLNFAVQAKKKAGKNKERPVYSRFEKFFNYKKELNDVESRLKGTKKDNSRFVGIGKYLKKGE